MKFTERVREWCGMAPAEAEIEDNEAASNRELGELIGSIAISAPGVKALGED